jgi:hypothetical protein
MFLAAPDEASADTLPEATAKELQLIEVTLS